MENRTHLMLVFFPSVKQDTFSSHGSVHIWLCLWLSIGCIRLILTVVFTRPNDMLSDLQLRLND